MDFNAGLGHPKYSGQVREAKRQDRPAFAAINQVTKLTDEMHAMALPC